MNGVVILFAYILAHFTISCGDINYAQKLESIGNYKLALQEYLKLIDKNPKDYFSLQGAASCYANLNELVKAGELFTKAASIYPAGELYMNAGLSFHRAGKLNQALEAYEKCIQLNRGFRECYIKIASVHRDLENIEDVERFLRAAIKLDPGKADAYSYLGDTLNNAKQFSSAFEVYRSGIKVAPNDVNLLVSAGDVLTNMKRSQMAFEYYKSARLIRSGSAVDRLNALIGYVYSALDLCVWHKSENNIRIMMKTVLNALSKGIPSPLSPYRVLFLPSSPLFSYQISASWSSRLVTDERQLQKIPDRPTQARSSRLQTDRDLNINTSSNRILRLGFLSRRIEDYAGTHMMLRLYSSFNTSRALVRAFANGADDGSIYRQIVAQDSDEFVDLSGRSMAKSATIMKDRHLDVLFDCDGLHDYNSVRLLSYRVSRIQVTWLGFPATTGQGASHRGKQLLHLVSGSNSVLASGVDSIDYLLCDKHVVPPDTLSQVYSEKLVYFPGCYQPQDELRAEDRRLTNTFLPPSREGDVGGRRREFLMRNGLEKTVRERGRAATWDAPWLICVNRIHKVTAEVFGDWMMVLSRSRSIYSGRAAPVLWLMVEDMTARINLQREVSYWGIEADRVRFLPRLPRGEYAVALGLADILLDTSRYGSHTVASDGIFAGLPMVTVAGDTFSSRVGVSLNVAIGLVNELVASNQKEYVDLILRYLHSRDLLYGVKRIMLEQRGAQLFNSPCFARKLVIVASALLELQEIHKTDVQETDNVYFEENSYLCFEGTVLHAAS